MASDETDNFYAQQAEAEAGQRKAQEEGKARVEEAEAARKAAEEARRVRSEYSHDVFDFNLGVLRGSVRAIAVASERFRLNAPIVAFLKLEETMQRYRVVIGLPLGGTAYWLEDAHAFPQETPTAALHAALDSFALLDNALVDFTPLQARLGVSAEDLRKRKVAKLETEAKKLRSELIRIEAEVKKLQPEESMPERAPEMPST